MFQQRETSKKSSFWSFFLFSQLCNIATALVIYSPQIDCTLDQPSLCTTLSCVDIIDYYPCCNKYHNWSDKLGRSTKLWRFRAYSNPLLFPSFSSSHLFDPDVADVRLRSSTLFASNATSLSTLSIWNCITLMPLDRQQRYFYPVFFQSWFKFLRYSD